jgi:CRP-like cAMP-binding protein
MAVSARAWARLLAAGFERRYASGQILIRQGDPGAYVLALLDGRVKVFWRARNCGAIDTGRGHVVITDLDRLRAAAGENRRNV